MGSNLIEMEIGKIYFISFGGTTLIGRYHYKEMCNHLFFAYLHYWAGFESFRKDKPFCVTTGIEEIREASDAEKFSLLKFEIEYHTI